MKKRANNSYFFINPDTLHPPPYHLPTTCETTFLAMFHGGRYEGGTWELRRRYSGGKAELRFLRPTSTLAISARLPKF